VWDADSGEERLSHPHPARIVRLAIGAGGTITVAIEGSANCRLQDLRSGDWRDLDDEYETSHIAFTPDGGLLATAGRMRSGDRLIREPNEVIRLWTGRPA
jgi:hypothetical protein